MSNIKKVLVVSRSFSPSGLVGAFRPEGWARYFPGYGLHPTIVTPSQGDYGAFYEREFKGAKVVTFDYGREDELIPKNIITRFAVGKVSYRAWAYLSPSRLKGNGYYKAIKNELENESYDLMICTGPPYYMMKITAILSKEYDIPWVADTRDAWSTNLVSKQADTLSNRLLRYIEKKTLKTAEFISTVSPTNVAGIERVNLGKKVHVVENGFFEEDFRDFHGKEYGTDRLTIAYFGTLYLYQPVEILFEGLLDYKGDEELDYRIVFVGTGKQPGASRRIMDWQDRMDQNLEVTPLLERREALEIGLESDVLLLLASPETPAVPTKLYDYVALQRPILVVKNDQSYIYELLKDYPLAYFCDTVKEVAVALKEICVDLRPLHYDFEQAQASGFSKRSLMKAMIDQIQQIKP